MFAGINFFIFEKSGVYFLILLGVGGFLVNKDLVLSSVKEFNKYCIILN
jgi:hypothetical protein